jgi:adenosine 3'-phospho 5'-phosphosulfate transporter B3
MRYLNYPAKMLFKSSRVLVTMIFGSLFRKKIYPSKDYIVALSMAAGLTLFVMADAKSSPLFDINGVFIITIALAADGTILNLQEYCFKTYNATHDELIYYSYMGASIFLLIINIFCGIFFPNIQLYCFVL